MKRIVVLGAGFGGMELCALLSEAVAGDAEITLIDKSDSFVFGYSKLDVMFRGAPPESVLLPYAEFAPAGVTLVRDTITAIDPAAKRVTTEGGSYDADLLVIALGADYDYGATGLTEDDEFYSLAGAVKTRDRIAEFRSGRAVIGVCGAPFKCPPAPSECVLMLHDHLLREGVRDACEITLVLPFVSPVPPSPDTSAALVEAFAERGYPAGAERQGVRLSTATGACSSSRTTASSRTTSSSASRSTAHPMSCGPAGSPSTGTSRSTRTRWRRRRRASTRSATSRRRGHRRPACSRRAPPAASPPR